MAKILILVVEDDQSFIEFLAMCLKTEGYEVDAAVGGQEGCRKARALKPDLMILDLLMPGMHGFDVCETLRKDEFLSGMKILISSAKVYDVDKRTAMRLGADGFLTKPFTHEELVGAVRGLVGAPPAGSSSNQGKE